MPPKSSRPSTPAIPLPQSAADPRHMPNDALKNLRGTVLFAAIAEVYRSKITNKEGKHNEMEKNVWGCEQSGKASLLNQMLKGEGPFSVLYDQVATPSGHDLYVREHFNNGMGLWIVNKQFDAVVLSRSAFKTSTSNRVSGRTMYDNASDVILCNCKKAMSLVPKLAPKVITLGEDNSVVGYGSGETEVDFLKYINDGMYAMLNEKLPSDNEPSVPPAATVPADNEPSVPPAATVERNAATVEGNDNNDGNGDEVNSIDGEKNLSPAELTEAMNGDITDDDAMETSESIPDHDYKPFGITAPKNYRFPGYMAFACFGPTRGTYFSNLLNPKGNSEQALEDGTSTGRNAQRKEDAKRQKTERTMGPGRGFGMETKVKLASVAQSEESASMRQREGKIAGIVSIISSKERTREIKMKLLDHVDDKERVLNDIDKLSDEIDSLNNDLKELIDENRESSNIVKAVMKEAEESMGINNLE